MKASDLPLVGGLPDRSGDSRLSDAVAPTHPQVRERSSPLAAGEVLAERFSIEQLARRGGMAAVYRALDLQTGLPVAIKITGSGLAGTRARFSRESQILSELSHPGIVQHVGHGSTRDGTMFLAMEWLDGEDLSERLRRGPLGLAASLTLLGAVCEALGQAHSRGIVHRDLKPENLFLKHGDPGLVKILDFGIARVQSGLRSLTDRGTLLGTVGYMSPEQASSQSDVDARADVFALGCVLYECLTGKAPFSSAHPIGVLAKVLHDEPARPSEVMADIHPALDELVSRMLAKRRDERLEDASAVLQALAALEGEVRAPTALRRRSSSFFTRSEQRIVSVVFGKVIGDEAAISERLGVACLELSERYEAQVASLQGGALLIVLRGRGEANDRASQAALSALDLCRVEPKLCLTVATGLAETTTKFPVGTAIERAANLLGAASDAGPGVFLDEVTVGLIGLRFEVVRTGALNELRTARRNLDTARLLMGRPTPYLGRDRELRLLDEVLDECINDQVSRTVLVTGHPGIGKSRLAAEWLARGGRGGLARSLFARADPGSGGAALSLVQQLIRDGAGLREADPSERSWARLREHLCSAGERTIAFLGEILGLDEDGESSAILRAARGNPEIMREQVRRALHAWLDAETVTRPLVIVLEDLHWGDTPSVSFFTEAVAERPDRPLMLLGLARPEVEAQFTDWSARAALRLRLSGLVTRAAEQLVHSALGKRLEDEVLVRLVRTAEGNPFYLEELIRRVAAGETDWPDTVVAMAQSRIEQLGQQASWVLRAASVFGERCWDLGVAEILGDDIDVRSALETLADSELLLRVPEARFAGAREYRFRHALLRDATYQMMTDEDRRAAHRVAGYWLECYDAKDSRTIAGHFEAAGVSERALHWLAKAAKTAIDAGDTTSTIELADRGVRLGAIGAERGRFLLFRSYAELLRGVPDPEAACEALELLTLGTAPWWLGVAVVIFGETMRGRSVEALGYVELAREAPFNKERDIPFGQGLLTLVGGLVLLGRGDIAELIVERGAVASRSYSEPDPVFEAFLDAARGALAAIAPVRGRWRLEEALIGNRRCAETLSALGAAHGESICRYYLSVSAMHLGRYVEARDEGLRSAEITRRVSPELSAGWPLFFLAKAYVRLNKPDEALNTVVPLRLSQDRTVQQMLPVIVGEARLRQGRFELAEEAVRAACEGVSPRLRRQAACVMARAEIAQGRAADALSTVSRALEQPTSEGLESDIDLYTLRAEALLALDRAEEANPFIDQAFELVQGIADGIRDPELRRSFTENVEPCARALLLHTRRSASR
jgi:tetratricopeptide (TPR) repeat protein